MRSSRRNESPTSSTVGLCTPRALAVERDLATQRPAIHTTIKEDTLIAVTV
jgi:hypothetical protein